VLVETCIRKGLGLKAHRVVAVREEADAVVAEIDRLGRRRLRCSSCGSESRRTAGRQALRRWHDLRLRDRPLVLVYRPYRVRCPRCGVRVERVPWAARWARVTTALARSVALLARKLSWAEGAAHFGLNWKTVAAIVREAVAVGRKLRRWRPRHVLGIDEVSRAKGQRYLTLVSDLARGRLVWAGEGRTRETIAGCFGRLGPRRARAIRVVCCDMWAPSVEAVRRHLPQATLVFDRFHIVQHLNRAVDTVRRQAWRQLAGTERPACKRTRWLWLKNPWNLKPKERRRLSALCRLNLPIVRAYLLKEEFQRFWDYVRAGKASQHLAYCLSWATRSRLEPMKAVARLVKAHLPGILAWTRLRIRNGTLEGMNNKVQVIAHRAYGFRKPQTYITAIYHCCADLPLP
jgi:transposase